MHVRLFAAAVMVGSCGSAHAAWQVATSRHFAVYANEAPDRVQAYATRLERFDRAIRALHGTPEDRRGDASRVTVYVLGSVGEVQRLRGSDRIVGYYVPRTQALAFMPRAVSDDESVNGLTPQVVMFHEYTHHWMLTTWTEAAFPAWYTEGAAELHATAKMLPDGGVVFGASPMYRSGHASSGVLSANLLLRGRPDKLDDRQVEALYGRGWLLTDYLTFDPERRKALAAYIGAINSGKSIDEATGLLGDPRTLDAKLNAYGSGRSLPSVTLPASDLPVGEVTVRALGPGAAAVMPALVRSKNGVDKGEAGAVVALARQEAAPFPNDPDAQNELAEAEYDAASLGAAGDAAAGYARAEAAADRALAADPKSVHALLYKGMAEQELAVAAKKTDPATWAGVRRWYLAANRAETENPLPLIAFYDSFTPARLAPTKGAEDGLLYAYALAPHDPDLRMKAARVYLRRGDATQARYAIAPVAYRPDIGPSGEKLRKVLAALDANDTAAALAELDRKDGKGETKPG